MLYHDPRTSGSGFGWFDAMKRYLGMDFFRALARQEILFHPHPEELLATGNHALLITGMADSIEGMKAEGKPVDWVPLPVMWFAGPFAVLFRNAKHPHLGKRLIDFLLSEEGQRIISRHHIPNRPSVPMQEKTFARVMQKLKGVKPVPFDSSLGRNYQKNQEEALRLLHSSTD